jgi:hypothetical protein
MRLSSAREAKYELLGQVEPGIAVGLSPRPDGQFVVAVRAQTAPTSGAQVIAEWVDRYGDDIDARVIGIVRKQQEQQPPWYRQRIRPLRPGASVSHVDVTAGTIGTLVRRGAGGRVELLSNNHVLADENQAEIGDAILQPGAYDGGDEPDDVIGALASFVPVDPDNPNVVDCALSSIDDGVGWSLATFDDEGGLVGVFDVNVDGGGDDDDDDGSGEGNGNGELPQVAKHGRTTGRTQGTITAIELDNLQVQYDIGVVSFDDQIEVQGTSGRFSQGGDSGSLVFTVGEPGASGGIRAAGLLFAGSETGGPGGTGLTYANPIVAVLTALDATLVLSSEAED